MSSITTPTVPTTSFSLYDYATRIITSPCKSPSLSTSPHSWRPRPATSPPPSPSPLLATPRQHRRLFSTAYHNQGKEDQRDAHYSNRITENKRDELRMIERIEHHERRRRQRRRGWVDENDDDERDVVVVGNDDDDNVAAPSSPLASSPVGMSRIKTKTNPTTKLTSSFSPSSSSLKRRRRRFVFARTIKTTTTTTETESANTPPLSLSLPPPPTPRSSSLSSSAASSGSQRRRISLTRMFCFSLLFFSCFSALFSPAFGYVVPEEPKKLRLRAINSTAIHISWRPPRDPNHVIQGYQIHYQVRREGPWLPGMPWRMKRRSFFSPLEERGRGRKAISTLFDCLTKLMFMHQ